MSKWSPIGSLVFAAALTACGSSPNSNAHPATAREQDSAPLDLQVPSGTALRQLRFAMVAIDNGQYRRAIELLSKLRVELPNNAVLLHELALAHRLAHQPQRAVALLGPFRNQLSAELLASYCSALDESGKRQEAEAALREGIVKYASSGLLRSELGTLLSNSGRVPEAVQQYELGIKAEPQVPSNYYNAARLLADGSRRGMSLIYGEIFRLLEPDSIRSRKLAETLAKTAAAAVRVERNGDKVNTVISLAPGAVNLAKTPFKELAFENAFEMTFGLALAKTRAEGFSLGSLHEARAAFLPILRDPESPSSLL
ncbi:MAG TPA: hypothetical protein VKP30_15325, partial [Polyangiaceae bacterium]|nr:hypothetical protein [Polyangiaceae bacterium]